MRTRSPPIAIATLVLAYLCGDRACAVDDTPTVERETAQQFLDSQADRALAPDPNEIYRINGKRREVDIMRGVVASFDEQAPSRVGSGVTAPAAAGAPGKMLGLSVRRDPWLSDTWFQKAGATRDAGLSAAYVLAPEWQVRAEGRERSNSDLFVTRADELGGVRFLPSERASLDLGVHHARLATDTPASADSASFWHAHAAWAPENLPGLGLQVNAEQRTSANQPDDAIHRGRLEAGASYRLPVQSTWPGVRVYWREASRLGLLSDGDALDIRAAYRRTVGIEGPDGTPGGTVYTQLQQHGLSDARDALWIVGWRHPFRLAPDTTLETHIEQATPVAGPSAVRSFAAGGRFSVSRFPRDALVTDFEAVNADIRDSMYNGVQYTARVSDNTLGVVRTGVTYAHPHGDASVSTTDYKATVALGWREPTRRQLSLLGGYTFVGRATDEIGNTDRRAHIALGYIGETLDDANAWSARWSRRWDHDEIRPGSGYRGTTFELLRAVHDLDRHWSLSGHVAARHDALDGTQTGAGVEIGFRLSSKAVLAVGYNPRGFSDNELSLDERPQKGWIIRLRFFIDAALGRWLDAPMPGADTTIVPAAQ